MERASGIHLVTGVVSACFFCSNSYSCSDLSEVITKIDDFVVYGCDEISFGSASYVYKGVKGLKFSSSNNNGTLTLGFATMGYNVSRIVLSVAKYGSDSTSIKVNSLEAQTIESTEVNDYSFDVNEYLNSSPSFIPPMYQ